MQLTFNLIKKKQTVLIYIIRKNELRTTFGFLTILCFLFLPTNNSIGQCITTVNPSFEVPTGTSGYDFFNQDIVPGWKTTAPDGIIEFWRKGNPLNFEAADGESFVELNAHMPSDLYQDFETPQVSTFKFSFYHRGRDSSTEPDVCSVSAGPPGGPYTLILKASDSNIKWGKWEGTYLVPAGQNITRLIFTAVSTANGVTTRGNFLDNIDCSVTTIKPTILQDTIRLCSGESPALINNYIIGQNLQWYSQLNGGNPLPAPSNAIGTQSYYVSQTVNGCESLRTMVTLTIGKSTTSSIYATICDGEKYNFNKMQLTKSGQYADTLRNSTNCDSIITLNLNVNKSSTSTTNINICDGNTFLFNGKLYSTSGKYKDVLVGVNGCDSISILNLTVNPHYFYSQSINILKGEVFAVGENQYNESGTYTNGFKTINGCDSIVETIISVCDIPNVFTPNGDGINDLFMSGFDISIYDRYGICLFTGKNGWNGTFNGKKVSQDTYFYHIKFSDSRNRTIEKMGYVLLIR